VGSTKRSRGKTVKLLEELKRLASTLSVLGQPTLRLEGEPNYSNGFGSLSAKVTTKGVPANCKSTTILQANFVSTQIEIHLEIRDRLYWKGCEFEFFPSSFEFGSVAETVP
jgi:hypothetical protein